jgi:hypothetical protein
VDLDLAHVDQPVDELAEPVFVHVDAGRGQF